MRTNHYYINDSLQIITVVKKYKYVRYDNNNNCQELEICHTIQYKHKYIVDNHNI